jgi:hypothetical protein
VAVLSRAGSKAGSQEPLLRSYAGELEPKPSGCQEFILGLRRR